MRIAICIKAIKDELVNQQNIMGEFVLNPYDLFALNSILPFKEQGKHELICLTMGGNKLKSILEKCYAVGVDDIMWLNDIAFAGADTVATSLVLCKAIEQINDCRLVICGEKAVDGETGQVPPGLAQRLNMQYIGGVKSILEITDDYIVVETEREKENVIMKVMLPVVVSIDEFTTRMENVNLVALKKARKKEIPVYTAHNLGLQTELCGIKGSKTCVVRTQPDFVKKEMTYLQGTIEEKVSEVVNKLIKEC